MIRNVAKVGGVVARKEERKIGSSQREGAKR